MGPICRVTLIGDNFDGRTLHPRILETDNGIFAQPVRMIRTGYIPGKSLEEKTTWLTTNGEFWEVFHRTRLPPRQTRQPLVKDTLSFVMWESKTVNWPVAVPEQRFEGYNVPRWSLANALGIGIDELGVPSWGSLPKPLGSPQPSTREHFT